ncbi:MAG: 1-deoxy-D-xylulose-5-phosphate reductoisomerase [Candidatus Aminicenantes bacterium]|nr:1-deoxy-D-xylulose-5-phosphate reductoisomerase [Candidatus Aminicenantes bacterium]
MGETKGSLAILGSTGSIGTSCLDVVDRLKGRFRVVALAAGSNLPLLAAQVEKYRPGLVSVADGRHAAVIRKLAKGRRTRVVHGPEGAREVARAEGADTVVSAITGMSGFEPTLEAVKAGRRVALANKEAMVVGGAVLKREAARSGARIIPVDSEHSAVFQCLAGQKRRHVRRVILTASGGPFLKTPLGRLGTRTREEALRHPSWVMGRKVTVDSATLMNKGLELIEARWLFDLDPSELDVLVHPQSVVHALVEMRDGSVLAQLAVADMRLPIQYALTWPERLESGLAALDLAETGRLEFRNVDGRRFPLFVLARQALEAGGSLPVALNAANEAAVSAFLESKILFGDIRTVVSEVMDGHRARPADSVEAIIAIDREARRDARRLLKQRSL